MTWSAFNDALTSLVTAALRLEARIAKNATSATPSDRASEVDEARRGLRSRLVVAIVPSIPAAPLSAGRAIRTAACTRTGPASISPGTSSPAAARNNAFEAMTAPNSAATPIPRHVRPTVARSPEMARCSVLASRSASIGGVDAALRAGNHADSSVVITPTPPAMSSVTGLMTVGPSRNDRPSADISVRIAFTLARPTPMPIAVATSPTRIASAITDRSTCRRSAPIALRSASS